MTRIILALSILVFPISAFPGQVTQGSLGVGRVMAGYEQGQMYFFVDTAPLNPNGCSAPKASYNILAVDPSRSDVSHVLSILLSAKLSGSKIEVQIYDDHCFDGHATIRRVAIQ